mgnify:CR=1 FL=1
MKNQKVNGYVFITVTVIVTILVSTLTVAISGQNKSIELIQNYEKLRIIEEEISAIELVITDYLNNNLDENRYLTEISNFQKMYKTPSGSNIKVKISLNDNCFNINSLFYKNSSNKLDVNNTELRRLNEIFNKLKIDTNIINYILDWIDTDKTNIKNINESLEYKKRNIDWLPRNNLAVSNIELTMIPEISAIYSEVKEILCVNLYNNKINILDMNPTKLSYFLPFLSEKNASNLSNIIRKDIWPNSNQTNKTEKNISNIQKEIEQIIRRPLEFSEQQYLKAISFNSKSIKAQIIYEDKSGTQYFSSSKYEVDSDNIVKLIYRYGPFKKQVLKI